MRAAVQFEKYFVTGQKGIFLYFDEATVYFQDPETYEQVVQPPTARMRVDARTPARGRACVRARTHTCACTCASPVPLMTAGTLGTQIEVPLALVGKTMLAYLDEGQEAVIVCDENGVPLSFQAPQRVRCKVCIIVCVLVQVCADAPAQVRRSLSDTERVWCV